MKRQEEKLARRDFFKKAGLGAGAVGAAAVSIAVGGNAQAAEPETRGTGYRLTEHVKQAYASARF